MRGIICGFSLLSRKRFAHPVELRTVVFIHMKKKTHFLLLIN